MSNEARSGTFSEPAPGTPVRRGTATGITIALLVSLATTACQKQASSTSESQQNAANGRTALELLRSIRSGKASSEIDALVAGKSSVSPSDPDWPTITYLLGEAHRQRGQIEPARGKFRALVAWAASKHPDGPYGDTWGGSGLAAVGLWRWLQILDQREPKETEEVGEVIRMASALEETRMFAGMVRGGFLPALPLLEEDIKHLLAHVAWKARRPEAGSLFLDFLMVNSRVTLDKLDAEIKQDLLKKGAVVEERLELFRARRLLGQIRADGQNRARAEETLKRLWENENAPPDVRAEAGYEWANARRQQRDKAEPLRVLDGVLALVQEGTIAEQALFRRATIHNRGPANRNFDAFRSGMLELLERFPTSSLADDALFQLATEHLFRVDIDAANAFFERLRSSPGPNDFEDSAYFLPALGLIGRGSEADLGSADQLLETYLQRHPDDVFRLRCMFWRARVAELRQNAEQARRLFEQIVREAPYDYYAIRAHMHLEAGIAASAQPVPGSNSKTRRVLRDAYRASRADTAPSSQSVYRARLSGAVASGLYREVLGVGEKMSARIDDISPQRLDELGLIPAVSLLLALRQDAFAAKDSNPTADNYLRLAGLMGIEALDWPLALEIATVRGRAQRVQELQRDSRYLATLYPDPAGLRLAEPLARAAWPIEGSRGLSQSLMYSIMRQESRFYPKAVSQIGALGLFQITPELFDVLNSKWHVLRGDAARGSAEYLLDADNNIRLWTLWVEADFPLRNRSDIAQAMMMHQAGSLRVRGWRSYWQKLGGATDIEYRVETARFNETRNFVRRALRDMAIIDAAGVFDGGAT